ncbi:MAG: DUF308 domain-containing protein [Lachnospiraceae bacterium]|nr:DUF308 domain-containing protein [Lachnospiraceae bacterium]
MGVLSVILGVLMVMAGFSCIFTPLATFLSAGYFVAILFLVYGIMAVVRFFTRRTFGIVELVFGVIAIVLGVMSLMVPGEIGAIDKIILFLVSLWFVVKGLADIFIAVRSKDVLKGWGWTLFVGILCTILGIYSFIHPGVAAMTTGMLIGFFFVESGINMIMFGSVVGRIEDLISDAVADANAVDVDGRDS